MVRPRHPPTTMGKEVPCCLSACSGNWDSGGNSSSALMGEKPIPVVFTGPYRLPLSAGHRVSLAGAIEVSLKPKRTWVEPLRLGPQSPWNLCYVPPWRRIAGGFSGMAENNASPHKRAGPLKIACCLWEVFVSLFHEHFLIPSPL